MATPEEAVRDLVGPAMDHPDPTVRAGVLTPFIRELQAWMACAAELRGAALVEMKDGKRMTYGQIAREADLGSYQNAQKLIKEQRRRSNS